MERKKKWKNEVRTEMTWMKIFSLQKYPYTIGFHIKSCFKFCLCSHAFNYHLGTQTFFFHYLLIQTVKNKMFLEYSEFKFYLMSPNGLVFWVVLDVYNTKRTCQMVFWNVLNYLALISYSIIIKKIIYHNFNP